MPSNQGVAVAKDMALEQLGWVRPFTEGLVRGLSDEQLVHRAGGRGNHALWIMGHLAIADDDSVSMVTGEGKGLPDGYQALFKAGTEPVDDAGAYPGCDELLSAMGASRERLIGWFQLLNDDTSLTPSPEQFRRIAATPMALGFTIGAHEMFHAGQLAGIRASLGLARMIV